MTISQLKAKNIAAGGKFFDRAAMKHWGDTMKNFAIETLTPTTVRVSRKAPTKTGMGSWIFNSHTGRLIA
jgi:hypothetical protein